MHRIALAIAAILGTFTIAPASAQVVITQAKALAGGITPGDSAGYPITLSQPGAYRLESNLSVPANVVGIAANNNNIDIDLNGFTITGNGVGGWGIASPYGESSIHDGVISNFRYVGIYVRSSNWTIDNVKVMRNGSVGIDADGQHRISVTNSMIVSNGSSGIRTDDDALIKNSFVFGHTNLGIYVNGHGLIEGNNISDNSRGLFIIGGLVSDNSFSDNTSYAIDDGNQVTSLTNNSLYRNNPSGTKQIRGAINVYGNTCVGNPC